MEEEAERALRAAVPTVWFKAGGRAFAFVKFPKVAEPGDWWSGRPWVAAPWLFSNGLFGVEIVIEDTDLFTAIICPQYGEKFVDVEEAYVLLNTKPLVGLQLHDSAVQWLKGWAHALRDEAVKNKAVEKARRTELCRL
jgi:hypothetical protein